MLTLSRALGSCAVLTVIASIAACSSSGNRGGFQDNDAGASSSSGGEGGVFVPSEAGPVDENGCSDAAKLVYVLSYEGDLYSFAPGEKKFKKIGPLKCGLTAQQLPISMAVDRSGVAWVNIATQSPAGRSNTLYKVNTTTAECTPTNIKSSFIGGMGFSTDEGSKDKETLFVFGQSGSITSPTRTLDRVDFAAEKIITGPAVSTNAGELTGTGDGRLFGFILKEPQTGPSGKPLLDDLIAITQLDKKTGKDSGEVVLKGVKYPHDPGFAFSFWGGDFYVYSAPITIPPDYPFSQPPDDLKDEPTTDVARYSPASKNTEPTYLGAIGFHIVGAGVSTCAPLTDVR
ncbi:MAG: hypothetical protein JST00_29590 [Deltaproteobacteria bacterium]|nr:hypothetical protein [Deltaproteobacteria bacterium]